MQAADFAWTRYIWYNIVRSARRNFRGNDAETTQVYFQTARRPSSRGELLRGDLYDEKLNTEFRRLVTSR